MPKTVLEEMRENLPAPDFSKYKVISDGLRKVLDSIQIPSYLDENFSPVTQNPDENAKQNGYSAHLYQMCNAITEELEKAKEHFTRFCDPQMEPENREIIWSSFKKTVNRIIDQQKVLDEGIRNHPQNFELLRNENICKVKSAVIAMQTAKMRIDALDDMQIADSYSKLKQEYDREHADWKTKQQNLLGENPGGSLDFGKESNTKDLNQTNEEIDKEQKRLAELQSDDYRREMIRIREEAQKELETLDANMKVTLREEEDLTLQLNLIRKQQERLRDSFEEEKRLKDEITKIQKSEKDGMENLEDREKFYQTVLKQIDGKEKELREVLNFDECLKDNYEHQKKMESMDRLANDFHDLLREPDFLLVVTIMRPKANRNEPLQGSGYTEERLALLARYEEITKSFPEKSVFSKVENNKFHSMQDYQNVYHAMKEAWEKEKGALVQIQQKISQKELWFKWDEAMGISRDIQAFQPTLEIQKKRMEELENEIANTRKEKEAVNEKINKLVNDQIRESVFLLHSLGQGEQIKENELQEMEVPKEYMDQKTLLEDYTLYCRNKEEALDRNNIRYQNLQTKYDEVKEIIRTHGEKVAEDEIIRRKQKLIALQSKKNQIEERMERVRELYNSYLTQRGMKKELYEKFYEFEEGAEARAKIFEQARQFLSRFEDGQIYSSNSKYYSAIGTALIAICKMDPNHRTDKFPEFRDPLLNEAAQQENTSVDFGAALKTLSDAVSTYKAKKNSQPLHWIPSKQRITRLQYADELILFCKQGRQVLSEIKPNISRKGFMEKIKGDMGKRARTRDDFEEFLTEQSLKMDRVNDEQAKNDIMDQSFLEEGNVQKIERQWVVC